VVIGCSVSRSARRVVAFVGEAQHREVRQCLPEAPPVRRQAGALVTPL
jgi:hypothetical protein